jgi:hypothetical protein
MYFPKTNCNGSVLYHHSDTSDRANSPDERKTVLGPLSQCMSSPDIENE